MSAGIRAFNRLRRAAGGADSTQNCLVFRWWYFLACTLSNVPEPGAPASQNLMTRPAAMIRRLCLAAFAAAFLALPHAHAGEVLNRAPASPISTNHYLFYLHGAYPERYGSDDKYQYLAILQALADKGFSVIGEVRKPNSIGRFARDLAAQVRHLMDAGVPIWHIAVAGHSRGGFIVLRAAALLGIRDMRFGILAACGLEGTPFRRAYDRFLQRDAASLQGQFMVMWDENDRAAGDCDKAMNMAKAKYQNKVLATGEGHELFYKPGGVWIDPLADFIKRK
jgi:hypothetical protein